MNPKRIIVILGIVGIILVGIIAYLVIAMNKNKCATPKVVQQSPLSSVESKPVLTNKKEIESAAFDAVDAETKGVWDKKSEIKYMSPDDKAAIGTWWAHDAWGWIAWQQSDGKWKVLVSADGFDCKELQEMPSQHKDFFAESIYGADGKIYCYDHSKK